MLMIKFQICMLYKNTQTSCNIKNPWQDFWRICLCYSSTMKLFVRITPIWLFLDKTYPTRTNKRKDYSFTLFEKLMMGENKDGNFTKRGEITECYFYWTLSTNINLCRALKFKIIEKGLTFSCNFYFSTVCTLEQFI